jgi:carbon monoxide dehydrogenase subunit G
VHYEHVVEIAAPPDTVWRVLSDLERWPEWTRSARSVKLESGDWLTAASRAELQLAGGRPSLWQVTSLDDGRSFVWENRQTGLRTIAGHFVEPAGAGSRVRLAVDMSGPLVLFLRPYLAYVTRRNVGWEAAGLKRRSEELARG